MERPVVPTDVDTARAWIERYLSEVHTTFPGRVEAYDSAKQTADIQPMVKLPDEQPDGSIRYEDLPVLPSVPVLFPRSRQWFLGFSIDVGDTVAVHVAELSFAEWRRTAGRAAAHPGDLRRHHIANCIAVPGLYVTGQALSHAPGKSEGAAPTAPALVLGSDASEGTRVTIRLDGSVLITRGADIVLQIDADGTVHAGGALGDFIALATATDQNFATVVAAINALTLPVSGATAGPPVVPIVGLQSVAATKAKAT